jgi:predicted nucleic acid-binding protein
MYSFDASSMIYAWDNYPPSNSHFDSLWEWISEQIENKKIVMSKVAFEEVCHKIPECGEWLKNYNIEIYPLTASALITAQQIKVSLGIIENKYGGGVGENDLYIIAMAKELQTTLVSNENRQFPLPKHKHNYKIPAVCKLSGVDIKCISFIDLLKM